MIVNAPLLDHSVLGPQFGEAPYDHPFRTEFREWLAQHAPITAEPLDQTERFEHRRVWHRTLAEDKWVGLHWPREHGGRGVDPITQFMYYEELALAKAPEPVNTPGIILLGPTLMALGTTEMKNRFLPGILSGDEMWCQGFSEPDSGSDLASLRTRAQLDGNEWVIDGQKIWTTFGQYADLCFVLARTEQGSAKHRGLTLLICPTDQPGVDIRPIKQISGDDEYCEAFFTGARLPASWVVGEVGEGWAAAMTLFQFERGDQAYTDHARLLVMLRDAAAALDAAELNGQITPTRASAARIRQRDLWARAQELRQLNYRGALLSMDGSQPGEVGSITNLVWGELEKDAASALAESSGAASLTLGRHDTHDRLAGRAASIYSGTSEIQRNIISERLLGLPR